MLGTEPVDKSPAGPTEASPWRRSAKISVVAAATVTDIWRLIQMEGPLNANESPSGQNAEAIIRGTHGLNRTEIEASARILVAEFKNRARDKARDKIIQSLFTKDSAAVVACARIY